MPIFPTLPANAHIRFEDLARLAISDDRQVVIAGVRTDGSVVLANRGALGRLVNWVGTRLAGRRDDPSVELNRLLARQLMTARGGLQAIASTDRVGVGDVPLRNRDVQRVVSTLMRLAPDDPAAALELRDGYANPATASPTPERARVARVVPH